ncbi:uncharacterized protein SCODWIG_01214 [Saccharomycodes ludwigii]|uniref:Beta-mannosyltransferase 1 n=1 Tax=Saccharomycodes ludwigii TaxID=36035 RepID=A0A376B448_9ASCO|nr:uncharacterized protein SCODWIG_01214 [Saccharomycodes ludwigii]
MTEKEDIGNLSNISGNNNKDDSIMSIPNEEAHSDEIHRFWFEDIFLKIYHHFILLIYYKLTKIFNKLIGVCSLKIKQRRSIKKNIFLTTIVLVIIIVLHTGHQNYSALPPGPANFNHNKHIRPLTFIDSKKDYLNFRLPRKHWFTKNSRRKNIANTPVTSKMVAEYKFQNYKPHAYVSNLNIDYSQSESANNDREYFCSKLEYKSQFQYSMDSIHYIDNNIEDLIEIRQELLDHWPKYRDFIQDSQDTERHMTPLEIAKRNWFKFGTSAVWWEEQKCYFAVTRVMWSREGRQHRPRISLGRLQLFDKDWNEIKGRRIYFKDIIHDREAIAETIRRIKHNVGIKDCTRLQAGSQEYHSCVDKNTKLKLTADIKEKQFLDKFSLEFPTFMDIELGNKDGYYTGSEDPRVILKENMFDKNKQEPFIHFNMEYKDIVRKGREEETKQRRYMCGYFPLRKNERQIKFTINKKEPNRMEKNWTPFFHMEDYSNNEIIDTHYHRGYIHFIYSFKPLEILKCSLDDGRCEIVFDDNMVNHVDGEDPINYKAIRGGSQYVPLPSELPELKGKKIWVGFPKLHLEKCGCGRHYYRPMLSVLLFNKIDNSYHEELVSPIVDFDLPVLSWDRKDVYCDDVSVSSANSIAFWEIVDQNGKTGEYEDYLMLVTSEADYVSKSIILKGILDYVLGVYKQKDIKEVFDISDKNARGIIKKSLYCIQDYGAKSCREYNDKHPFNKDD